MLNEVRQEKRQVASLGDAPRMKALQDKERAMQQRFQAENEARRAEDARRMRAIQMRERHEESLGDYNAALHSLHERIVNFYRYLSKLWPRGHRGVTVSGR